MKLKHCNVGSLVFGAVALTMFSQAYAAPVSLNNTVMIPGTMTWMQDLSNVTSSTASNVTVMENMDGTTTYMGMDNVSMMVEGVSSPLWDYSWSLTADPDPFIGGSFSVTNTSSMIQTFDLMFTLPISPSFTNGYHFGSFSGSFTDADNSGGATLNVNDWSGLIDGSTMMAFNFGSSCIGPGCSLNIAEISQGPTAFSGAVNNTIGIHMNFGLSAGDSVTFNTLYEVTPVPVPAAVWLFGSGLVGLMGFARRK
ncbi:MAG: VPLPA-CTERM sorting domain-containing protein [Gammaproteobacteria bacterium]|nr:VPLPA-CTERM sorting domain-containing protein [Gammaproteobacteria bacterium]MDH5593161.1 VPLPA-CTERM sorting domain-containing protein [Gammaproteobacteria bacterium]